MKKKKTSGSKRKSTPGSMQKTAANKKARTKQLIVSSIAVGAIGILGYFGWQYLQKKKGTKNNEITNDTIAPSGASMLPSKASTQNPTIVSPARSINISRPIPTENDFPLKKGSKGEKVKLLQQALQAKYGAEILPKYGADGDFGPEMVNALKKAGLPVTITESLFNVLTQNSEVASDIASVGKALYNATVARNFNQVMTLLKKLQSTSDYTAASDEYKKERINGVRQTLVNGLLSTFTSTKHKEAIKMEFLRMGLQYDGKKWRLSGLDGLPLMTREATMVWASPNESVQVPARMILGNEVTKRNDYTLFENNGQHFLVATKSIQYL